MFIFQNDECKNDKKKSQKEANNLLFITFSCLKTLLI